MKIEILSSAAEDLDVQLAVVIGVAHHLKATLAQDSGEPLP